MDFVTFVIELVFSNVSEVTQKYLCNIQNCGYLNSGNLLKTAYFFNFPRGMLHANNTYICKGL